MVSMTIRSQPPSIRPRACSLKAFTASSKASGPKGSTNKPVGPISPATSAFLPQACLARQACGKKALVAGDIGPTGLFVEPFGPLAFEEAVNAFKEQARGLIDGGCDLIVIETMIDIQETRAALLAVKETKNIFTIVSMTYEKDGHTPVSYTHLTLPTNRE